ncbi:hypothetical protein [Streptomyces sp. NPDC059165]|uniref:hypothetical protein n=1 Tax=Streptomyces sp. NPDC059165 TaxID=3346751 RepID=UPI0036B344BD
MSDTVQGVILAVLTLMLIGIVQRKERRIRHLQALAGDRDHWDTLCRHCGKPIRDAASTTITRPSGTPGGRIRVVFHADRPVCDTAAMNYPQPPTA